MAHISGTVVTQIMVELGQCFGNVMITATIDDVQSLACVSVIEAQPIFVWRWNCRFCGIP